VIAGQKSRSRTWPVKKIAPDDSVTPDFAKKRRARHDAPRKRYSRQLYSNFSVISGNCNFALASDLTVPFPTPQKRQPFEAPVEARGKQGKLEALAS
jgi:hypothetical protein